MTRDEMVRDLTYWQRVKYYAAHVVYWIALKLADAGNALLCSCIDDPVGRKVFRLLLSQSRQRTPVEDIDAGARSVNKGLN